MNDFQRNVILFGIAILLICKPVPYNRYRNQNFIEQSSNQPTSAQNDKKEIIIVRDINRSGSFFTEGFPPPLPKRTAMGMSGSNPGSGSGSSSGSGNSNGSYPSKPISKNAPEIVNYGFGSSSKTKRQKALEKMRRELRESIEEEDKINAQRKKQGKTSITLSVKDGANLFRWEFFNIFRV